MSTEPIAAPWVVRVTFRYFDYPSYHAIFGRMFLGDIYAVLDMELNQVVKYYVVGNPQHTIAVVTRDVVQRSKIYQ